MVHEALLGVQPNWYHLDQIRPYVQRLGGGSSWAPVVWCNVEREPGSWDWSSLDRIVHEARGLHLALQFKVRVGACWLTERGPRYRNGYVTESEMPSDLHAYAAFVRAVVNRYAPMGVHTYAIENEPNTRYQWGGTLGQLLRLTEIAASAIRRADPRASVADWGLSTGVYGDAVARRLLSLHHGAEAVVRYNEYYRTAHRPSAVTSVDHLRATLDSGQDHRNLVYVDADEKFLAKGVFDVRQLHFYEAAAILPSVIDYLRVTTPANVPVEVWELGRHVGGGVQQLPAEVVKSVCLLLAAGAREVNWLPLAAPSNGNEPNFALLGASGSTRPAGVAYRKLAQLVARASTIRSLTVSGMSGLVATRPDHTTLVLWSDPPWIRRLRLPAGSRVTALAGSVTREGRILEAGSNPVLIEIDQPLAALRRDR